MGVLFACPLLSSHVGEMVSSFSPIIVLRMPIIGRPTRIILLCIIAIASITTMHRAHMIKVLIFLLF